jgi:hypothetical protein
LLIRGARGAFTEAPATDVEVPGVGSKTTSLRDSSKIWNVGAQIAPSRDGEET